MALLSKIVKYTNDFLRIREIDDWDNALNGLQIENSGGITKIGAALTLRPGFWKPQQNRTSIL